MNDLISREAAIAHAISGRTREFDGEKWIRVSEVRESLQTMPPAQSNIARDIATIIENEKDMRVLLNAQPRMSQDNATSYTECVVNLYSETKLRFVLDECIEDEELIEKILKALDEVEE